MSQAPALARPPNLREGEFLRIRDWIHERAGIHLADQKMALVAGRLASRLRDRRLASFGEYYELLAAGSDAAECQLAIDLITTNETSFFREPRHFELLRTRILPRHERGRAFRVWSAACSSGEEPYSVGMVLAEELGSQQWEILGSDLSHRMLARAQAAIYRMERARTLPLDQLRRHCRKGMGRHAGSFQVGPEITSRVRFAQINLNAPLPDVGMFDLILLRNVMIYFNAATKQQVVDRLCARLSPGGHLLTGHSESLMGLRSTLKAVAPATYRKA